MHAMRSHIHGPSPTLVSTNKQQVRINDVLDKTYILKYTTMGEYAWPPRTYRGA